MVTNDIEEVRLVCRPLVAWRTYFEKTVGRPFSDSNALPAEVAQMTCKRLVAAIEQVFQAAEAERRDREGEERLEAKRQAAEAKDRFWKRSAGKRKTGNGWKLQQLLTPVF